MKPVIVDHYPWGLDRVFIETYKHKSVYTLVDICRCYELWTLVKQTACLEGALIEVGVFNGGSGAIIARSAKISGIEDTVYLCDTFRGTVKPSEKDSAYNLGGQHVATRAAVDAAAKDLQLDNVEILVGCFPENTAHLIKEDKVRFCHLDVDTYLSAKDCAAWVWDRLVVGGILVFDDYGAESIEGITQCVDEFREEKGEELLFIWNVNTHGICIKR